MKSLKRSKSIGIKLGNMLAIMIFTLGVLTSCGKETIKLKEEVFTIEYGTEISKDPSFYLEGTEDALKDSVIDIFAQNEDDKEYPSVGEYTGIAEYDKTVLKFKIQVVDTKAPEASDFKDELLINIDAEDVDYAKFFNIDDLSEMTVTIDTSQVNFGVEGIYPAKLTATDKYENKLEKEFKVSIVSSTENLSQYVDGTAPQLSSAKQENQSTASNGYGDAWIPNSVQDDRRPFIPKPDPVVVPDGIADDPNGHFLCRNGQQPINRNLPCDQVMSGAIGNTGIAVDTYDQFIYELSKQGYTPFSCTTIRIVYNNRSEKYSANC